MVASTRRPDLTANLAGIVSPNPFWLASAPPTNTYGQVARAFDCGWGGAVWKTLGQPIVNVYSRYGGNDLGTQKLIGLNNIELITDRPLKDNLREMKLIKKRYPKHALIASLMVESKRETWHEIVKRTHGETGCDGFEL
ncbi:MAG: NAD-dependent dihydropyrimidine dehydrogenase subunit PreA, partial [Deltaproteobacteria bacterium]|nr:NAD-dependent dihydropyrimidine dehydrogenase subunit PreA [Deltaproteobacteria bacterium]